MKTRHTTHPPAVPVVERATEGGNGGDLPKRPLDGRGNQGSDPRQRRCRSKAHNTRPPMSLATEW